MPVQAVRRALLAFLAQEVLRAMKVSVDFLERSDIKAIKETTGKRVIVALLVIEVLTVLLERLALKVLRAQKGSRVPGERLDRLVLLETKANQAFKVFRDTQELLAIRGTKEPQVEREAQVRKVIE